MKNTLSLAIAIALISQVYATTPQKGKLTESIQIPIVIEGRSAGSMSVPSGSEITILKVDSDGVLIARGESTPVKVPRESISAEALALAEATPTPIPAPTSTPVSTITPQPAPTPATSSNQMPAVVGNKIAVDCQTLTVPKKIAESILAEYKNSPQKNLPEIARNIALSLTNSGVKPETLPDIASNIATANHTTLSKFPLSYTSSGAKLDISNGSDRLEIFPIISPNNDVILIEGAFSNQNTYKLLLSIDRLYLIPGAQIILGSFDTTNYNSEVIFIRCDLTN